jgi:hypothetical protein
MHKLSGGTFRKESGEDAEATGQIRRSRSGFVNSHTEGPFYKRGLTEAINEHMTLACESGDFATLDPEARHDTVEGYWMERKLLSTFIDRSEGLIDFRTICRASYEDNDDFIDRRLMVAQAREAFGPGVYNRLEVLMGLVEGANEPDKDLIESLAERIHPPELDDSGNVVRVGWIDLEGLSEAA